MKEVIWCGKSTKETKVKAEAGGDLNSCVVLFGSNPIASPSRFVFASTPSFATITRHYF
jgi:hypothetical protein